LHRLDGDVCGIARHDGGRQRERPTWRRLRRRPERRVQRRVTAGLHKSITAAAHSATVIPVSQRLLRRPSHSAAAAKQTGSGTSHSAISGTTIPTGHASVPIACVQTGQGKVVNSATDANTSASTKSDHRTALASRRFQGEGA
jgi:hypothetical protein